MTDLDVVRALSVLAQQSRLQIFRQLVVAGNTGMTPTQISAALGLPGTGLSFHLKELANAGLITQERDGRNLIYRAALSLFHFAGYSGGVEIVLKKHIPTAAGLGGGSSDAATTLMALNDLCSLNFSRSELMKIGAKLGADVPFFMDKIGPIGHQP